MLDSHNSKAEVDYSSNVNELIPSVKMLAESGDLDSAIEQVLALEKQTRLALDHASTKRLLETLVVLLAENHKWANLNDTLILMTKKHGQTKQAVTKMVQKAVEFLPKTPDEKTKVELINALRTVTEGKIYVETERARITKELASIKESHGDLEGAAHVLQDLQVETFGSMEKSEKVEFMLEQMRLCLAINDYVRTQIISRKISTKFFNDEKYDELKLKYYNIMIELDGHEFSYLKISKHYWEVYNTKSIQDDERKRFLALKHSIAYLLLAPYDNEQCDLICRRKSVKDLEKIPLYGEMLIAFSTEELLIWNEFCAKYEAVLRADIEVISITTKNTESDPDRLWKDMHSRVIEHNIRVIAGYYTQIHLSRLSELLELDGEKTEEYLSKLVVNKTVYAKIDRLLGIVHFVLKKSPTDVLNDWSYNTKSLMSLINQTTHLINKEKMIQGL